MSGPSGWDTAADIGWNVLTGIPGVGTAAAGASAVNDVRHLVTDDKKEDQQQAMRDLAGDCISMIPLVGTVSSIGGAAYDVLGSNDTAGNLQNKLLGGKDAFPADSENGGAYVSQPAGDKTSGGQMLHNAWDTVSDPFGAMVEGQRKSDEQRAKDGSTTGELPQTPIPEDPFAGMQ
ncbi:MAG TPA: hypothetical protein VGC41_14955 [Kofleriaceae bacterium]